ncbi:protein of unknown function [Streptomyces sp. KY75]|nr:protein of unknown function [Streptomyces sp. KY70]CAD5991590.1 protein of unknown function [Streptomyces sp. KY75]
MGGPGTGGGVGDGGTGSGYGWVISILHNGTKRTDGAFLHRLPVRLPAPAESTRKPGEGVRVPGPSRWATRISCCGSCR